MKTVEPMGRLRNGQPVDNPDDILDTESMILKNFQAKLGVPTGVPPRPVRSTTASSGEKLASLIRESVEENPEASAVSSGYENAMIILMNLREKFIDTFEQLSGDDQAYSLLRDSIHSIEAGLGALGAEVDPFNPLSHLSGLTSEDIIANAQEVVNNTKTHYSLHSLEAIQAGLSRSGAPCINISILGKDGDTPFRVTGSIYAPDDFSGNEAIDFVNNDGQGLLTVKAVSLGKWVDVSDRFDVRWDIVPIEEDSAPIDTVIEGNPASTGE